MASHFLPRYAVPEIPLRATATMLLLFLVWSSLRRIIPSWRASSCLPGYGESNGDDRPRMVTTPALWITVARVVSGSCSARRK